MHPLIGPQPAFGYMQGLPGQWSGTGQVENTRSTESPYTDKGKLRSFFKDLLLYKLRNYSI